MAAIKVHVGIFSDDGTASCDFRGERFVGSEQGDHHRTVLEIDPASDEEVELCLSVGPSLNQLFKRMVAGAGILAEASAGARIGVWDE